ncbi:MAG: PilX N-terminal domain-containing pilus assembly protein [Desulfurivibrionaceae bacterium]
MKRLAINEEGFLLVTAMVVLLLLTLLGLSAMRNSSIELLIAGNDKFHKEAFYSADSAVYMTPKFLTQTRNTGADPVLLAGSPITLFGVGSAPSDGTRFYDEVMGFTADAIPLDPDYRMQIGLLPVDVDIQHTGSHAMAGGGVEFAAAAGGGGTGSAGGVWIGYTLTSSGQAPRTISTVSARYRYVPGTTGGLQ